MSSLLQYLGVENYLRLNDLGHYDCLKMVRDNPIKQPRLLTKVNTVLNFAHGVLGKRKCLLDHFCLYVVQHNVKAYQRAEAKFLELIHQELVCVFAFFFKCTQLSLGL